MSNQLDIGPIAFKRGNIEATIESELVSNETKAIAICALSEHNSIIANLSKLIKQSDSNHNEIKILVCAVMLCQGDRKNCVGIYKTINIELGLKNKFFLSTYNFLGLLLAEYEPKTYNELPAIIGDSHVLGLSSCLPLDHKQHIYYCPGLRASFLSHPQYNIKKENIKNALVCAAAKDSVAISMCDIDIRSIYEKQEYHESNFKFFIEQLKKSHDFVLSNKGIDQGLTYILPTVPYKCDNSSSSDFNDYLSKTYEEFEDYIQNSAKCLYVSDYVISNTHKENFIDVAHYKRDIYEAILNELAS